MNPAKPSLLAEMLSYCRPHGSVTTKTFCHRYLMSLPDMTRDIHGNFHCDRGRNSTVLWSAHVDTVHRSPGMQRVKETRGRLALGKPRDGVRRECLGGDDTVGVYLLREMVLAGIPGHYVFHVGEERGCIGSRALADSHAVELQAYQYAIALDRAGISDVVTYQHGKRCCSEVFSESIAGLLTDVAGYSSAHGVYTDTAEYVRLIPECTNLSVGYYHQHTAAEYVDTVHVRALREALLAFDETQLVCERNPAAPDEDEEDWPDWRRWIREAKDGEMADDGDVDAALSEDDKRFLEYLRSR